MSVHVDELHTDVLPAAATQRPGEETPHSPWAAEEQWQELRCRAEWLAQRTSAVDFDD